MLVSGGLRWCVGNGKKIKVWYQPWLRNVDNYFITTLSVHGLENLTVVDLISNGGALKLGSY